MSLSTWQETVRKRFSKRELREAGINSLCNILCKTVSRGSIKFKSMAFFFPIIISRLDAAETLVGTDLLKDSTE